MSVQPSPGDLPGYTMEECQRSRVSIAGVGNLGNDTLLALAALGRAAAARLRREVAEAETHHRQALSLSLGADFGKGVLRARIGLAAVRLDDGDSTRDVTDELEETRSDAEAVRDVGLMVSAIEQLARVAALCGEQDAHQRLLAQAGTLRSIAGRPRGALDHRDVLSVPEREAHRTP